MKALVVDDEEAVRNYLQRVAEAEGFETAAAEDGEAGWGAYGESRPDLVLTDVRMPRLDGLGLLERVRAEDRETVVVVLTGHDEPEYAREALRLGASNFLRKPVLHTDLVLLLRKYAEVIRHRRLRLEIGAMVSQRSLTMRLDNRMELPPRVADFLVRELGDRFDPDEQLGIHLGLVELLSNAIEHGNLGITFEEKCAAMEAGPDALADLRRRRLADPARARRRVAVQFSQNDEFCEWIISDEGEGFDAKRFIRQAEGENLLACNGRGILLSMFHFDELEYIGRGNIVRARRYCPPKDKPPAASEAPAAG